MPTISQLPTTDSVTAADMVPVSQAGTTRAVSVGTLLASTQPAILTNTATLLGRVSVGAGGPEEVDVGTGLVLTGQVLAANGADHAGFPESQTFTSTGQVVVSTDGQPGLLPITALRGLFSAGQNISITSLGVVSATGAAQQTGSGLTTVPVSSLPLVTTLAAQDLVAVNQNGSDCAITLANFLDGQTIDMAQAAALASDTDTFWVAQGTSTMLRQTLSAVWTWMTTKLPGYKLPVVEISANTTLDGSVHNGRILVCTAALTLSPAPVNMGSGFQCDVINLSASDISLATGITTSSGLSILSSGQCMRLYAASYSGGTIVYGWMGGITSQGVAPGAITDLSSDGQTTTSVSLTWSVPSSGGSIAAYTISFRLSGTSNWSTAAAGVASPPYTVTGLTAGTAYDFMVIATNGALTSSASNIVTSTTSVSTSTISAPTNLVVSGATSSSIALAWSAPATGTAQSYTIQYRPSGTSTWSGSVASITALNYTVTALSAGQSYDWRVAAVSADGSTAVSAAIVATTLAASGSVTSITWNVVPGGPLAHGTGVLAMNAHVSPSTSAIQFGVSTSETVPPTSWTAGSYVNTDLWGAYVPTPATAGTWYAWAEGVDGSAPTVYAVGIVIS
jgi:hypothetical protein